jgi:hypothetical protein
VLQVCGIVQRGCLGGMRGLVRDLEDRVAMPRANVSDCAHVRRDIDGNGGGISERDDFHVKAVLFSESQQRRQRAQAVGGRQLEEHVRHDQHANERQVPGCGPFQVGVRVGLTSVGNELDETERGDTAPLKGRTIRLDEVWAADAEVFSRLEDLSGHEQQQRRR